MFMTELTGHIVKYFFDMNYNVTRPTKQFYYYYLQHIYTNAQIPYVLLHQHKVLFNIRLCELQYDYIQKCKWV